MAGEKQLRRDSHPEDAEPEGRLSAKQVACRHRVEGEMLHLLDLVAGACKVVELIFGRGAGGKGLVRGFDEDRTGGG